MIKNFNDYVNESKTAKNSYDKDLNAILTAVSEIQHNYELLSKKSRKEVAENVEKALSLLHIAISEYKKLPEIESKHKIKSKFDTTTDDSISSGIFNDTELFNMIKKLTGHNDWSHDYNDYKDFDKDAKTYVFDRKMGDDEDYGEITMFQFKCEKGETSYDYYISDDSQSPGYDGPVKNSKLEDSIKKSIKNR